MTKHHHTLCSKIFFVALTAAVSYQTLYNLLGIRELGGKYLDLESIIY